MSTALNVIGIVAAAAIAFEELYSIFVSREGFPWRAKDPATRTRLRIQPVQAELGRIQLQLDQFLAVAERAGEEPRMLAQLGDMARRPWNLPLICRTSVTDLHAVGCDQYVSEAVIAIAAARETVSRLAAMIGSVASDSPDSRPSIHLVEEATMSTRSAVEKTNRALMELDRAVTGRA